MNTQTKERPQQSQQVAIQPVARLAPSRLPITPELANRFQVSADQWRVLVEQIFPAARSVEAVGMALSYCRHRNLDIYKKPVHIVPVYSSALKRMVETVWPGISELRTTASRTGHYAGLTEAEFGPIVRRDFVQIIENEDRTRGEVTRTVEYPEWVRMTAYRMLDGQKCAFTARIFWMENYATAGRFTDAPNEMWRKRPHGQLEKCCEAAVLRKAFPEELGGEYAAEEMQGRVLDDDSVPVAQITEQPRPQPPRPPRQTAQLNPKSEPKRQPPQEEQQDEQRSNVIDAEVDEDMFPGDLPSGQTLQQRGKAGDSDADTPEDGDDTTDFLYRLEEALKDCGDKATLDEVWNQWAPEEKFADDEMSLGLARSIKRRVAEAFDGGRR